VLDNDRDRQRISLGLKQTQTDPWQQVIESYDEDDVVKGRVTKVVTFGAFVEILPGVEGLVHISELAQHHVENPREIVSQGEIVTIKIIEMDADRRRLSLSLKRVEPGEEARPPIGGLSLEPLLASSPEPADESAELGDEAADVEPLAGEPVAEADSAPAAAPVADSEEPGDEAATDSEEPAAEAATDSEEPAAQAAIDAEAPTVEAPGEPEASADEAPAEPGA
jgi:small subunit ribosomal protein S1